jgi:hypothetical protein
MKYRAQSAPTSPAIVQLRDTSSRLVNGKGNNGSNDYFPINRILIINHGLRVRPRHGHSNGTAALIPNKQNELNGF